jgi:2-C-methyl-D-erythritol 4-phosphate cytidylyltransferase
MSLSAIIVAGGSGQRFGLKKQFLELIGIPVLKRAVTGFITHGSVDQVIVVVPEEDLQRTQEILSHESEKLTITKGGKTRQQSVFNGLHIARNSEAVLIHDGVRPFVSHGLITRVIEGLTGADGCIPALAVTDTLKEVHGDVIRKTIPRQNLYQVQTPQAFHTCQLIDAHEKALETGIFDNTDDSALMESMGKTIKIVQGDPFNMKITFEKDLTLAEAILTCHIV